MEKRFLVGLKNMARDEMQRALEAETGADRKRPPVYAPVPPGGERAGHDEWPDRVEVGARQRAGHVEPEMRALGLAPGEVYCGHRAAAATSSSDSHSHERPQPFQ